MRHFYRALADIGIDEGARKKMKLSYHSGRYTAATMRVQGGMSINQVMDDMGWSTAVMVDYYYSDQEKEKRAARSEQIQSAFFNEIETAKQITQ